MTLATASGCGLHDGMEHLPGTDCAAHQHGTHCPCDLVRGGEDHAGDHDHDQNRAWGSGTDGLEIPNEMGL